MASHSIVYAIYYSFFEVFPLVFPAMYGFNEGESGLAFLSILAASMLSVLLYWAYLYYIVEPDIRKNGMTAQERRLILAFSIFTVGIFLVIQCFFIYLPMSYPVYAASLFAANDFCRSALAAAAILFADPLFAHLGVARGVSLLAGLTCGCIAGIWLLYFYGAKLRARSKFTIK